MTFDQTENKHSLYCKNDYVEIFVNLQENTEKL